MPAPERLARTVLVVGLVLATSTPLVWEVMTPPADAGTLPTAVVTASPVPPTVDVAPQAGVAPQADTGEGGAVGVAGAEAGRGAGIVAQADTVRRASGATADTDPRPAARSARIADLDATASAAPERLRIPSLDVDAPVVSLGVDDDGDMQVPEDVGDVGWYRYGPTPGEPGTTVIAGHVDSRAQGAGAFFNLRRLDVGARVKVTGGAGDVQRYDVVARRTYDKSVLPTDELFSRDGPSQLVLITCGGDFDREAGSYRENVVIYAQPSSSST